MSDFFAVERLKRELTIPEAACLWCDLPFTELESMLDALPGQLHFLAYLRFNRALAALIEATNTGLLATYRNEDGYSVDVEFRTINRDYCFVDRYRNGDQVRCITLNTKPLC